MTVDFAKEYLLDDCDDCPENENGECMTQSHCFEVKRMAIQALERTRWIPVSERLPKEYDLVLVTEKYGLVDTARFVHNDFTEMDEWIVADDETIDVIAWMPLPQPYKGESEDCN